MGNRASQRPRGKEEEPATSDFSAAPWRCGECGIGIAGHATADRDKCAVSDCSYQSFPRLRFLVDTHYESTAELVEQSILL